MSSYYNKKNSNNIIEASKELLRHFGYFVDNMWHVEDVHFICEQHELPKLSDAEAMEVFMIAKEHFDGDIGISWPQLDKAVRMYIHKKAIISSAHESTPV